MIPPGATTSAIAAAHITFIIVGTFWPEKTGSKIITPKILTKTTKKTSM
jgi:hypothetical protein